MLQPHLRRQCERPRLSVKLGSTDQFPRFGIESGGFGPFLMFQKAFDELLRLTCLPPEAARLEHIPGASRLDVQIGGFQRLFQLLVDLGCLNVLASLLPGRRRLLLLPQFLRQPGCFLMLPQFLKER